MTRSVTVVRIKRRSVVDDINTDEHHWHDDDGISREQAEFPPELPTSFEIENLIRGFCSEFEPVNVEEVGCAACAQLTLKSSMRLLADVDVDLYPLQEATVARRPLLSSTMEGMSPEWTPDTAIC
ncbi:hypothetical protein AGABI2DRAFT_145234 [Agaricus bisporus var. bisporus H97]|uniref:hypothetical protein n=1 Tax=Agaricus bisporus var. bisporus (strain H97 / ATCC MYA-4626 / FGSC 10389) TaxID=936046 RepID=UPI00029F73D1|nr:hypothetical protein AGABI2DRAFT_145234 [Agaricus bisporus var. bisporus H97]EKV44785.1 hypothetical protein AGABI2DRAFT_145234 [Agaricus bisporus var. bisporus H97]